MNHRIVCFLLLLLLASPAIAQNSNAGPTGDSGSKVPNAQPASASPSQAMPAPEKIDPAKDAAIRHLMDLTGAGKLGGQMVDAMMPQMRSMIGQMISESGRQQKFLDTFFKEFRTRFTDEDLVALVVPIYARHYSLEDIQGMNQFYESPLGQRVVRELPQITAEARAAGAEMGQKAAMDTLRAMSKDYPELDRMLPEKAPAEPQTGGPQ
jgi:uncharacterized protein